MEPYSSPGKDEYFKFLLGGFVFDVAYVVDKVAVICAWQSYFYIEDTLHRGPYCFEPSALCEKVVTIFQVEIADGTTLCNRDIALG